MKILFVEPPKEIWFVMGEYLPPPFGLLALAAYVEREVDDLEIEVLDCNAKRVDWKELEKRIESSNPDVLACSSLATCNTYTVARTLETAKRVNPNIITITGGQHFTSTAQESLISYPEIDVIVRGEGELALAEVLKKVREGLPFSDTKGVSFRCGDRIVHNPPMPLIENLDELPFPGYHFVKDLTHKYHFVAMTGRRIPYAIIEGSRGCPHNCSFCSQWRHWLGTWRLKSPKRIVDEMEYCYRNYGSKLIWLTDDNFGFGQRAAIMADDLMSRGISDDLMWFVQARCDDVVNNKELLPRLRRAGLRWVLLGVESLSQRTLDSFRKGITSEQAKESVRLLKENDIFAHAMFIIGERSDSSESISNLRKFIDELDPDFVIFAILTPFPGTVIFEEARRNGWIEDFNWSHYDMTHAIMPTETLSRKEIQEELYECYRSFYGPWKRRLSGLFSKNEIKRSVYWYMILGGIIDQFRGL